MKTRLAWHLTLQTKSESATAGQLLKFQGIIPVLWMTVQSPTGKLFELIVWVRSEGSLNQHLKLKHPEYYRQQM